MGRYGYNLNSTTRVRGPWEDSRDVSTELPLCCHAVLQVQHPDWTAPSKKAMGKYTSEPSFSWGKCGGQRAFPQKPSKAPVTGHRERSGEHSSGGRRVSHSEEDVVSSTSVPGAPFLKRIDTERSGLAKLLSVVDQLASATASDAKVPGPGTYKVRPADIMKNRAPNQPRPLQVRSIDKGLHGHPQFTPLRTAASPPEQASMW